MTQKGFVGHAQAVRRKRDDTLQWQKVGNSESVVYRKFHQVISQPLEAEIFSPNLILILIYDTKISISSIYRYSGVSQDLHHNWVIDG